MTTQKSSIAPYYAAWVSIITTLILILGAFYLYAIDDNPPAIVDEFGQLDKAAYYPGETAILNFTLYERQAAGPAILAVSWICSGDLNRQDAVRQSQISPPVTEPVDIHLAIVIRDDLPIGETCYSTRTASYQVNALAPTRSVTLTTSDFLVLPRP